MLDDIKPPKKQTPKQLGRRALSRLPAARGLVGQKPNKKTTEPVETIEMGDDSSASQDIKHFRRLRLWWRGLNRNVRFGIIAAVLLLYGSLAIAAFYYTRPNTEPELIITKTKKVAPKTVPSPLTGVQVAPELAQRPVTAIMIENSPDARPQSGLEQAGVVFEAIAEGGITRFLSLFQEAQPSYVGPVRSLRPYYIDWAAAFDASIAHIGGSPDALAQIRNGGKDLDQFFNSRSYWRQPTRASPHNVYTSFEKLDALNKAKGYTSSKFTPWPRKKDKVLATPTAKTIDIKISSARYNVHYDYNSSNNTYLRSEGGTPHPSTTSPSDSTGQRLAPKVVIVLVMSYGFASDGRHSVYSTSGKGTVYIFQDGGVTVGTWSKPDRPSQFSFLDASEVPTKLNAGQAWVSIVSGPEKVSYAP